MCTGQPGWSAADDCDFLAAGRGALKQLHVVFKYRVCRVSLQQANLDRLLLVCIAHTSFLAKNLSRTNTGAHTTHNIFLKNGAC